MSKHRSIYSSICAAITDCCAGSWGSGRAKEQQRTAKDCNPRAGAHPALLPPSHRPSPPRLQLHPDSLSAKVSTQLTRLLLNCLIPCNLVRMILCSVSSCRLSLCFPIPSTSSLPFHFLRLPQAPLSLNCAEVSHHLKGFPQSEI